MRFATLFASILLFLFPSVSRTEETISLFDGETLDGWQTVDGEPVSGGWEAVDGTIHLRVDKGRPGQIVTTRQFRDFELRFEWKIDERGNSGIKYRVDNFGGRVLGCEYQILGPAYPGDLSPKNSIGSLYDVYEPTGPICLNPEGEYNRGRIIVFRNYIQHWLNGHHLLTAVVGSSQWYRRKASSKFAEVDGFGENRLGRIMLTDHGSEIWYRHLELTPLRHLNRFCHQPILSPLRGILAGGCRAPHCQEIRRRLFSCQRRCWLRCRLPK